MKGKVLKPHPNRSCDLMQLPCQNLSSGKPVGCLGGQRVRGAQRAAPGRAAWQPPEQLWRGKRLLRTAPGRWAPGDGKGFCGASGCVGRKQ